ncbi:HlyD family efflux transporter periplasmic adaptor subunit, partial [Pseudomonas sp. 2822-17]|uniref:HlyD family efflux transporter periplasmic adaptor subunit n=1 Tax=Pseudomonas sp. 2822-17 TaxID=1712678 RepID=UPI001C48E8D5
DITSAELNLERQQIQLDNFRTMLEATQIYAPISGIITSLADLKVGEILEPFETLVTIADPDSLHLVSNSIGSRQDELS